MGMLKSRISGATELAWLVGIKANTKTTARRKTRAALALIASFEIIILRTVFPFRLLVMSYPQPP
jgi:hypothetical protein